MTAATGRKPCPHWRELTDEDRKEYWASLALRYCRGVGARSRVRLLRHFGSAYAAVQGRQEWQTLGLASELSSRLAAGEWRLAARQEWDAAIQTKARILLWTNEHYPPLLRALPDAPVLLYCKGDISLLHSPCLAIVGSRKARKQTLHIAGQIATQLSACGITVVSGMANGVDTAAHRAALHSIGRSIGVLGTGIDVIYPSTNATLYDRMTEQGLLLSEFSPSAQPAPEHFPIRNRIISGLSLGVLVVEAARRSGSLITARHALEQNRDVYAIPGTAFDQHNYGAQELVRQGARPVFCAEDILVDLAPHLQGFEHHRKDPLSLPEKAALKTVDETALISPEAAEAVTHLTENSGERILALLQEKGALDADALTEALQVESAAVTTALVGLELAGRIRRLPGARFEVVA